MGLGFRLELRQSQGLVLTPQLQQAIKLLQVSNLELAGIVAKELADNPFLAQPAAAGGRKAGGADREAPLDGALGLRAGPAAASRKGDGGGSGGDGGADGGWSPAPQSFAADRRLRVGRTSSGGGDPWGGADAGFEARLGRPVTLGDHLREQLAAAPGGRTARAVAGALVDCLDECGYLREPDEALAAALGVPAAAIAPARALLRGCSPAGVGARDLAECLALQLAERDRLDPAMRKLLENLPLVARADFAALQRACRVDLEDVRDMIGELKALDPRPGLSFAPAEPVDAVPDILVSRVAALGDRGEADGAAPTWRVELNDATLPRLVVDRPYYATVTGRAGNRREREFMSERYQAASWLVKALDQRARTLVKVGQAIFGRQAGFLLAGPQQLRPLVLRDIAEATGLHESTVSRATADKFAGTPRGTFPLRYFFTTAIAATTGDGTHSAEAVRQRIKRMVGDEDPENVLSDDQIVDALRARGVAIARRTVAKYRESLNIPSSVQRRRSKALSL